MSMLKRLLGMFTGKEEDTKESLSPAIVSSPKQKKVKRLVLGDSVKDSHIEVVDKRSKEEIKKADKDLQKLQISLINWIPQKGMTEEREYQNSLVRFLAPKFDKVVTGKGKYKADVLVNNFLPIELTFDLKTENKYDLLCDMVEHYLDEFGCAIIIIIGVIDPKLSGRLEAKFRNKDLIVLKKIR